MRNWIQKLFLKDVNVDMVGCMALPKLKLVVFREKVVVDHRFFERKYYRYIVMDGVWKKGVPNVCEWMAWHSFHGFYSSEFKERVKYGVCTKDNDGIVEVDGLFSINSKACWFLHPTGDKVYFRAKARSYNHAINQYLAQS